MGIEICVERKKGSAIKMADPGSLRVMDLMFV